MIEQGCTDPASMPELYSWYRHHKNGDMYQVRGFADLEATGELMVIYRKGSQYWVRPAHEWASRFGLVLF